MSLGLGVGASIVTTAFYPTQVPGCLCLFDANLGFSGASSAFGGTLKATGTTPPAVTQSGTPTMNLGLRLEITTGGAYTVGVGGSGVVFRWSADNGTTWTGGAGLGETGVGIPTGGTYLLPGTGVTVSFPSGTYATNNVYQITVANWTSQKFGSDVFGQATATAQPIFLAKAINSLPAVQANSVTGFTSDWLLCSTITLTAPGTTPVWLWGVFRSDANAGQFNTLFAQNSSTYKTAVYNSSGTAANFSLNNGNIVDTNTNVTTSAWRRLEAYFSATTADYLKVGSSSVTGASAGNTAATAGIGLFSRHGDASTFIKASVAMFGVWNQLPSSASRTQLDAYVTATFGSTVQV